MRLCQACQRPEDDDAGASFTTGYLCKTCGYYRVRRLKKTSIKTRRPAAGDETRDMPVVDPGTRPARN